MVSVLIVRLRLVIGVRVRLAVKGENLSQCLNSMPDQNVRVCCLMHTQVFNMSLFYGTVFYMLQYRCEILVV